MTRDDTRLARRLSLVAVTLLAAVVVLLETAYLPPFADPMEMAYVDFSRHMAKGDGLATSMLAPYYTPRIPSPISLWPPLYPASVAALSKLGFAVPVAARLVSVIAFALTVAVVWQLGTVVFDRTVGTVAALGLAVWPPVARIAGMALSENLFVLLVLGSLLITVRLIRGEEGPGRWPAIAVAGGLVMGGAALTRYVGLALVAIGALAMLANLRGRSLKDRLAITTVWSVSAVVPSALLLVRNVLVTGALIGAGRPPNERGLVYHILFSIKAVAADVLTLLWRLAILPEAMRLDSQRMVLVLLAGFVLLLFGLVRSTRVRRGLIAALRAPVGTPDARFLLMIALGYWVAMLAARSVMGFMALSTRMMLPVYPLLLLVGVAAVVSLAGAAGPSARRALTVIMLVLAVGSVAVVIAPRSLAAGGPRLRPGSPPRAVVWVAANTPPGAPIIGNGGTDYNFYLERPVLSFASFLEYRGGDRFERDCRTIARNLALLGWERPYLILRAEDGELDAELLGRRYGPTIARLLRGEPALPVRLIVREREFVAFQVLDLRWSCAQD